MPAAAFAPLVIEDVLAFAVPVLQRRDADGGGATGGCSRTRGSEQADVVRRWWLALATVSAAWADALAHSETVAPLLARYTLEFPLPRRLRTHLTWIELRRRVHAARFLAPLAPSMLTPIEDCGRGDCPCFAECLVDTEHTSGRDRRVLRRCETCARRVPGRRNASPRAMLRPHALHRAAPHFSTAARDDHLPWLRRPVAEPTYGTIVFDVDGKSAEKLLRCVSAVSWASSAATRPSLRTTYGSCMHQYEWYPVTLARDARGGYGIPSSSTIQYTLHEPRRLVLYSVLAVADPTAFEAAEIEAVCAGAERCTKRFTASNVRLTTLVCGSDGRPFIVPSIAEATALVDGHEQGCGSEVDYDDASSACTLPSSDSAESDSA